MITFFQTLTVGIIQVSTFNFRQCLVFLALDSPVTKVQAKRVLGLGNSLFTLRETQALRNLFCSAFFIQLTARVIRRIKTYIIGILSAMGPLPLGIPTILAKILS